MMNQFQPPTIVVIPPTARSRIVRRFVVGLFSLTALAMIGGFAAQHCLQWQPSFYARKLAVGSEKLTTDDRELERQVETLHKDVRTPGDWTARFSEEQVNGWLAVGLRQRFPRMLPDQIREPRVAFSAGLAQVACQYCSSELQVVLSLDVDVSMSSEPNVVAVRVKRARVGAVPGLLQMATASITNAAMRAKIPLQWTEIDGDKVALITVPENITLDGRRIFLDRLRVEEGELCLAGRSEVLQKPPQIAMR